LRKVTPGSLSGERATTRMPAVSGGSIRADPAVILMRYVSGQTGSNPAAGNDICAVRALNRRRKPLIKVFRDANQGATQEAGGGTWQGRQRVPHPQDDVHAGQRL